MLSVVTEQSNFLKSCITRDTSKPNNRSNKMQWIANNNSVTFFPVTCLYQLIAAAVVEIRLHSMKPNNGDEFEQKRAEHEFWQADRSSSVPSGLRWLFWTRVRLAPPGQCLRRRGSWPARRRTAWWCPSSPSPDLRRSLKHTQTAHSCQWNANKQRKFCLI